MNETPRSPRRRPRRRESTRHSQQAAHFLGTAGSPPSPEIPEAALISEGIALDDYDTWRMDIEDQKRREREMLADAAEVEKRDTEPRARGMEPMPPRRVAAPQNTG